MRLYAIGDIHGQREMLEAAHRRIAADRAETGDETAPVVHLGDLGDRGPDTAGVIRLLLEGIEDGQPWRVVKGNHDAIFAEFLQDPTAVGANWLSGNMGGAQTLASYGVEVDWDRPVLQIWRDAQAAVPDAHRRFLAGLEPYIETDALILVHAGIRPGVPLDRQDEEDLIWIRAPFLYDQTDHGRLVVHGHTPVEAPEHRGNRVDLDTGAGFGRPLTAAVFEGRDCWILTDAGRVPLLPPG